MIQVYDCRGKGNDSSPTSRLLPGDVSLLDEAANHGEAGFTQPIPGEVILYSASAVGQTGIDAIIIIIISVHKSFLYKNLIIEYLYCLNSCVGANYPLKHKAMHLNLDL